tara:strand:+ start:223 stop:429 length:207 start_codon:yes stop_codon:yes gene_type:complete
MKVGTLIKYKYSASEDIGVIVGTSWDHTNCKVTGEIHNTPVYQIQWVDAHPLVKRIKYLRPDSMEKVA